mgnify:FL=1
MPAPPSNKTVLVSGYCDPKFQAVKDAFTENLQSRNEIGASVSIVHKGKTIVDLWGGYKDSERLHPWEENTLVCVMSVSKAIASIAVLSLVDKKIIDIEAPVAKYWPEFAQGGKENITVRCMLAQLAGIPVVDAAPENSLYDYGVIEHGLEIQKPLWPAGSTPCYHSFTHGPLCQQLVYKTTGKSLNTYLKEDVFAPLGLGIEFHLGLSEEDIARCADITVEDGVPSIMKMGDPDTLLSRAWRPMPKDGNFFQDKRFRTFEFASGNGHSNARSLAKLYGTLAMDCAHEKHAPNQPRALSKACLEDAIQEQWNGVEVMTHRHFRFGTGFMLNNPYFRIGNNARSFGHPGLGGANSFADPDSEIGFGYCGNRVHAIDETGPCATALIDALYKSL